MPGNERGGFGLAEVALENGGRRGAEVHHDERVEHVGKAAVAVCVRMCGRRLFRSDSRLTQPGFKRINIP